MNTSRDRSAAKHQVGALIGLNDVSRDNASIREHVGNYFGSNGDLSRKVRAVISREDGWFYLFDNQRLFPAEWFDDRRRLPWRKIGVGIFTFIALILIPLISAVLSREDVIEFGLNLTPGSTVLPSLATTTAIAHSTLQSTQGKPTITIDVARGHRIVAFTINGAIDVSNLVIDFEGNEPPYRLGELFSESISTQAGQVWCLQQLRNTQHLEICADNNTWQAPDTGIDWRNLDLKFMFRDDTIGECAADPINNTIYSCESLIINTP